MKHLIKDVDHTDPSLLVAECGHVSHASYGDQIDIMRFGNVADEEKCQECACSAFYTEFVEEEKQFLADHILYEHTGYDPNQ